VHQVGNYCMVAPTCFGSRRNHHQGAVLCLAKTTKYGILLVSVDAFKVIAAYHPVVRTCGSNWESHVRTTGWYAWWWFLCEPKHVGASVI